MTTKNRFYINSQDTEHDGPTPESIGVVMGRFVRGHNRKLHILLLADGSFNVRLKTLVIIEEKPRIMRTDFRLSPEAMSMLQAAVTSVVDTLSAMKAGEEDAERLRYASIDLRKPVA